MEDFDLSAEEIQAALAYYEAHQAEVDAIEEEKERQFEEMLKGYKQEVIHGENVMITYYRLSDIPLAKERWEQQ